MTLKHNLPKTVRLPNDKYRIFGKKCFVCLDIESFSKKRVQKSNNNKNISAQLHAISHFQNDQLRL